MLPEIDLCTGCSACEQICPTRAIELCSDKKGLMVPVIGEQCIHCKLCESICPALHHADVYLPKRVYAAVSNEGHIIEKSSSGGVFTELARHMIQTGGIVCGCAMERTKAKHIIVDKQEDLIKLQGSKYVRSDTRGVYSKVKEKLEGGIRVLFSGTPCQIDALKKYLRHDYANLLTVDIICHGCPPQKFLDAYVEWLEKKYKSRVSKMIFRDKSKNGWGLMGKIEFENKRIVTFHPSNSSYYYFFDRGEIYSPACYQCKYAKSERISDITLGDYWGIERDKAIARSIDVRNGVSLVLVNSEQGLKVLDQIRNRLSLFKGDLQEAKIENIQLSRPVNQSKYRAKLLEYAVCGDYQLVEDEYRRERGKFPILSFVSAYFPARLKYWLKKWR